jgi:tRNA (guanine37-N1)-methyltransferase
MRFHVMTLFPEMIREGMHQSITGRAMDKGLISVNAVDIRDYTQNKNRRVDDYPYGGGAGMVMQAQPVYDCYQDLKKQIPGKHPVIYMTPQGRVFNQSIARELAEYEDVVLLCGHYEGIDERALELIVTDQISIGDFVLTGGELPAMMIMDCVSRLVPGVLNNDVSADIESFHDNLLEYPQYTRPDTFMGKKVPEVLFTGHHANIEKWRREQSIIRTLAARPDLLEDANLSDQERQFLKALQEEAAKENTAVGNNHTDHKK